MNLYERYAPPLGSMQLIFWLATFVVLPFFFAFKGFAFAILTLAVIVGLQPHITRLSEKGHKVHFALAEAKIFGKRIWKRRDLHVPFYIKLPKWLMTVGAFTLTLVILPSMIYIIYKSAGLFAVRIDARSDEIMASLAGVLNWAREVAPEYVPEGEAAEVFSGFGTELLGDAKHIVAEVSKEAGLLISHITTVWFEILISSILLGVLIKEWVKEKQNIWWRIEHGIPDKTLVSRIKRAGELYQDALSVLLIGYLEVGFTLSLYYFVIMSILPLNLGIGFIVTTAIIYGFATAIWKVGGIAIKIISPALIVLYFQDGFGYFGNTFFSFGLGIDLFLKAIIMLGIAFVGGYLEAYDYTPEKIGKKLEMTKMEMVMTILIWAIGAKFMGMLWGVLIMLLVPTFTKLYKEELAKRGEDPSQGSLNLDGNDESGQAKTA